jgi:hypothetical protein
MTRSKLFIAGAVAVLMPALAILAHAQTNDVKERFTFMAANGGKAGPSGEGRLELVITRWSSDAERDRMLSVVSEEGPDKLLDALHDAYMTGWIHWPGNLDYTLRYARRTPRPDGGEDVVLVTDSRTWIGWDSALGKGWTDSPFTVIHLRLDQAGAGEGKVSMGTKIRGDKEAGIVLDDYANQPTLLTDVRRERNSS